VEQKLRSEIARLVNIGVLEEDYTSEWASSTFAFPRKNGTIRVVSDFRKLNFFLKCHPFPLPKIQMNCIQASHHPPDLSCQQTLRLFFPITKRTRVEFVMNVRLETCWRYPSRTTIHLFIYGLSIRDIT